MARLILWKPLYLVSIAMFVLSLVLFPFNQIASIVVILALVTLWSRIPGFVHFIFNKLALNDLFAFLVGASLGGWAGAWFGVFGILGARIFGPYEDVGYSIRATIAVFFAGLATPAIIQITGGVNIMALYLFEAVLYAVYYLLVVLFWKQEIPLEIMILPGVIFFDFVMNAALVKLFGNTISSMMTQGLETGWPFIIFAGIILGFIYVSRNASKWGPLLKTKVDRIKKKIGFGKQKAEQNNELEGPRKLGPYMIHKIKTRKKEHAKIPETTHLKNNAHIESGTTDHIERHVPEHIKKHKKKKGWFSKLLEKIGS